MPYMPEELRKWPYNCHWCTPSHLTLIHPVKGAHKRCVDGEHPAVRPTAVKQDDAGGGAQEKRVGRDMHGEVKTQAFPLPSKYARVLPRLI